MQSNRTLSRSTVRTPTHETRRRHSPCTPRPVYVFSRHPVAVTKQKTHPFSSQTCYMCNANVNSQTPFSALVSADRIHETVSMIIPHPLRDEPDLLRIVRCEDGE
jgi:hypothetical protein